MSIRQENRALKAFNELRISGKLNIDNAGIRSMKQDYDILLEELKEKCGDECLALVKEMELCHDIITYISSVEHFKAGYICAETKICKILL